jgi:hypothetical protein
VLFRFESSSSKRPIVLALIVGMAVGAAEVLGGLWLAGALGTASRPDDVTARIAALETQLKTPAKPVDNPAIADLTARLGKLEQSAAKPAASSADPAIMERLAAVETAMKALGVTLTALNRRAEESATTVSATRERADAAAKTAEALQTKLAAIEQSAKVTQDKVAQNSGSDTAARRAVAAVALRDAVARGVPYTAELATAKQLGADAQAVGALEPFAASGVPTEAALSRDLSALLPSVIEAAGADAAKAGGFFERLQANASRLVRVRPIDAPAGDDASAVLARIEVKAARNDLAGIETELGKLPAKARSLADAWRKKLAARNAAIAASRQIAADSASALGSPRAIDAESRHIPHHRSPACAWHCVVCRSPRRSRHQLARLSHRDVDPRRHLRGRIALGLHRHGLGDLPRHPALARSGVVILPPSPRRQGLSRHYPWPAGDRRR